VVDKLNVQLQLELQAFVMGGPAIIGRAIGMNHVSRCPERIADHATDVAEMVSFLVKGQGIRHAAA